MFGEKTYEIMDEDPMQLLKVKGFGKKQLKSINEVREIHRINRSTMTFLGGLGFSQVFKNKIYIFFKGSNIISIIKENPYKLTKIKGIGFVMADNIAFKLGFDRNSPKRAACALIDRLEKETKNGHTCFPKSTLLDNIIEEMEKTINGPIKRGILESSLEKLIEHIEVKLLEIENVLNEYQNFTKGVFSSIGFMV